MNKRDEFLKSQKVLRLATVGKNKTPHIVPVWYMYSSKKIYIGTYIKKNNRVSFCVDVGVNAPNIYGVKGEGNANLILEEAKVKKIATKILLRYFKSMKNKSAQELLDDTDCVIEIIPESFSTWSY
jgi:general stress protein 26